MRVYSSPVTFVLLTAGLVACISSADEPTLQSEPVSPYLAWVDPINGGIATAPRAIAVFPDGSAVVAGQFRDHVVLGEGGSETTFTTGLDRKDSFLARYTASGALEWAKHIRGEGEVTPSAIAADADGTFALIGRFRFAVTIGRGESQEIAFSSGGEDDSFLARYKADGTLIWATQIKGEGNENLSGVVLGADGSVVVAGGYGLPHAIPEEYMTTLGEGEANEMSLPPPRGRSTFVARYRADGSLSSAWRVGDRATYPGSVSVFPDGAIVVVGGFSDQVVFGEGQVHQTTLTSEGIFFDAFVARYDSAGALMWARRAGGAGSFYPRRTAALPDGSVVVAGSFSGTARFGGGDASPVTLVADPLHDDGSGATEDAYMARYDKRGTLVWAQRIGGRGTEHISTLQALPTGGFVAFGNFDNEPPPVDRITGVFGPATPEEITLQDEGDPTSMFVAWFAADGSVTAAKRLGGGQVALRAGGVSAQGTVTITGSLCGTSVLGLDEPGETLLSPQAGANCGGFVAGYQP